MGMGVDAPFQGVYSAGYTTRLSTPAPVLQHTRLALHTKLCDVTNHALACSPAELEKDHDVLLP